jgi:hypothetical protein
MSGESFFSMQPDPPVAGQPLIIRYKGTSPSFDYKVDSGPPVKVSVPPNFIEITCPGGSTIWVNDHSGTDGGLGSFPIDNAFAPQRR